MRPPPAMIVAIAALFMALSGTTYAVTKLPSRSVGSAQLKKGAVRSVNIARGAVSSSKLSTGLGSRAARTGKAAFRAQPSYAVRADYADNSGHADTATLADKATTAATAGSAGSVTSATNAASAGNADTLDGKDSSFFVPKGTIVDVPRFTLSNDETRDMLRYGPFTITARCYINQIAADDADVLISTTQPHSVFQGFTNNPDFNPGDLQSRRSLIGVDGPTGLPQFESAARGAALAPDGTEIRSIVIYAGLNLFGEVGRCTFGGFAVI